MKCIHLTDPHLVTPGDKLKGLDPAARLEPAFADIARHHADAECCVITGDLADIGEVTSFGIDDDGQLYTVNWDGELHRIVPVR